MSPAMNLKSEDITFCREMRDPIYDYVYITNFEDPILNSPIFQRLDRIFQMPTAQMVYPSAKHTRKVHSLGVMQLAHEAIVSLMFFQTEAIKSEISPLFWEGKVVIKDQLEKGLDDLKNIREEWWHGKEFDFIVQGIRIAGMLHDIGHAPFSHLFEDVCKSQNITIEYKGQKILFDHEVMSRKIIEEKEDTLGIKRPFTSEYINDVLDKENGKAPLFVKELISSGYDCDKLDYLRRDSYATGTLEFGRMDYRRIIAGLRVFNQSLCVSTSSIDALMNSFDALRYMYTSVYYHRTTRIFDFMIHDAFSKIPEFLQDVVSSVDHFLEFNDYNFITKAIDYVNKNKTEQNKDVAKILTDFLNREKRYKEIFCHRLTSGYLLLEKTNNALLELEKHLEEMAQDLEIRVDFGPKVRPVGVNLEELSNWLLEERFYDPTEGKAMPLHEISQVFHYALQHYTVLFRIFVSKEQLDPNFDTQNKFRSLAQKIHKEASERIKKIEEQYERL